jgi:hypothetical protein
MRMRLIVGAALMLAGVTPALAAGDNAMKVCGAKYQAAKTGKTLPAGQTWNQFLGQCRASMSVTKTSVTKTTTRTTASPAQVAMRSRQQACAKQWQADKAAGKVAGQTWPKYWSQCNARMKG